ncbi:MAG: antA/AntB antirepressor family protein [Prevotellaceae bacterium]|jgi:phage anti-repressor protein|nr:antA/AntB antirepressor family protein [Prevotellaceae bacterium]
MKELIPISEHNGQKAVSARLLHAFLESKQDFSTWIKNRIEKYGFIENQDFEVFHKLMENPSGGRPLTEYALTINAAKELAMVEGNERGKQARQYFIGCEQKLKEASRPLSTLDLLELTIKGMRENQQEVQELKRDVLELKAKATTHPDYFTIAGYGALRHTSVTLSQASSLGRQAALLCKARGIPTDKTPDPRFGNVNTYPASVLDEVFEHAVHSNAANARQAAAQPLAATR